MGPPRSESLVATARAIGQWHKLAGRQGRPRHYPTRPPPNWMTGPIGRPVKYRIRSTNVELSTIIFGAGSIVMRLNRSTLYAVVAVLELPDDKNVKPLSCRQLCEQADLPERYLLQILRKLVIAGVVDSVRGAEGGFRLAKPLNRLSLLELVEAVDELPQFNVETLNGLSSSAQWTIGATMAGIREDARKRLGAFTLDRLQRQRHG